MEDRAAAKPPVGRRPTSVGLIWLAGAVGACGLVVAVAWGLWAVNDANEHVGAFARVDVPGQMSVTLGSPSDYHLYLESDDEVALEDLAITVTDPTGKLVVLRAHSGGIRYDVDGRVGHPVATFRTESAGSYEVVITDRLPGSALAVGDGYGRRVVPHLVGAGLLLLSALASWSVLAILAALRHARVREESTR